MNKSYLELISFDNFEDRFKYLICGGHIGVETFGHDRILNQTLYTSPEWKRIRDLVIIRDNGCDLGVEGYPIGKRILIHHINPITVEDVINRSACVFDMNNLICVSHATHNALHYSDMSLIDNNKLIERSPWDTCPWKKGV